MHGERAALLVALVQERLLRLRCSAAS